MKVFVIDAAARTIEHHELADTKAIVDFFPNGISHCGALNTGDVVYIDELAMHTPAKHFFIAPCNPQPLPTKGLVVGPDADDGKSTLDVRGSIDALRASIQWLDRTGFEAWANDRGRSAATSADEQTLQTWSELAARSRAAR